MKHTSLTHTRPHARAIIVSAPPAGGAPMLGYRFHNHRQGNHSLAIARSFVGDTPTPPQLRSGAVIGRGSVDLRFVFAGSSSGPCSLPPAPTGPAPPLASVALPLGAGRYYRPYALPVSTSAPFSLPSPSTAAPSLRVGRAKALPPTPRPTARSAPDGVRLAWWTVVFGRCTLVPTSLGCICQTPPWRISLRSSYVGATGDTPPPAKRYPYSRPQRLMAAPYPLGAIAPRGER